MIALTLNIRELAQLINKHFGEDSVYWILAFLFLVGFFWGISLISNRILLFLSFIGNTIKGLRQACHERQRNKEVKADKEVREKWGKLCEDMHGHYKAVLEGVESVSRRDSLISRLEEFKFSVPSEADKLKPDFKERWLKYLETWKQIYLEDPYLPPTDKEKLTLWERC